MNDASSWITLVTSAPGGCALAIVFWILLKELPDQRKAREKMTADYLASTKDLMKGFREEMTTERLANAEERHLDRTARHAGANQQTEAVMALHLAAEMLRQASK